MLHSPWNTFENSEIHPTYFCIHIRLENPWKVLSALSVKEVGKRSSITCSLLWDFESLCDLAKNKKKDKVIRKKYQELCSLFDFLASDRETPRVSTWCVADSSCCEYRQWRWRILFFITKKYKNLPFSECLTFPPNNSQDYA